MPDPAKLYHGTPCPKCGETRRWRSSYHLICRSRCRKGVSEAHRRHAREWARKQRLDPKRRELMNRRKREWEERRKREQPEYRKRKKEKRRRWYLDHREEILERSRKTVRLPDGSRPYLGDAADFARNLRDNYRRRTTE